MGPEPEPIGDYLIINAYNWYNYMHNSDDANKFLFEHLRKKKYSKSKINSLKKLDHWSIPNSMGWQARMLDRGFEFPEESRKWFADNLNRLFGLAKEVKKVKPVVKSVAKRVPIQESIQNKSYEIIGDLETEVDNFTNNNYKSDFEPYKWFRKNDIKAVYMSYIINFYTPQILELKSVSKNKELKEAYADLSIQKFNRYVKFLSLIVSDAEKWKQSAKRTRKVRAKKPIMKTKLVEKVRYEKENSEYKIASIDPTEIIGANVLYVFNTKRRIFGVYTSKTGFSVKGTTILNVDSSLSKRVRKPVDLFKNLNKAGKIKYKKTMEALTTKEIPLVNRLNNNIIILKVF